MLCAVRMPVVFSASWLSLSEMLEMYPEDLRHMVTLAADAYLELIDALKNIILKPEQVRYAQQAPVS